MPRKRMPEWLRKKGVSNSETTEVKKILNKLSLNTVCRSAKCPNQGECFASGTATFMIMGDICTRNCRFCAVDKGDTAPLDPLEPARLAQAIQEMQLKHVVITSVTRDDLADGGAIQFVRCIQEIRKLNSAVIIEILTPDFQMNFKAIDDIIKEKPDIFNHNVETVPRLYSTVRPMADYHRSLKFLQYIKEKDPQIFTKSGLMVGLGESSKEVIEVMKDIRGVACDILTIGQYLQPSNQHLEVVQYIHPEQFENYKAEGNRLGYKYVAAGPFVRSSFHAADFSQKYLSNTEKE